MTHTHTHTVAAGEVGSNIISKPHHPLHGTIVGVCVSGGALLVQVPMILKFLEQDFEKDLFQGSG
jgi:hypothetical protein